MMKTRTYPLLLVLMGSMDCITTVIGIMFCSAVELNPILSGVVSTNLSVFVFLKLTTTVALCLIFFQAERILMRAENKTTRAFSYTRKLLKIAYVGVILFMTVVVANNIMVLLRAI